MVPPNLMMRLLSTTLLTAFTCCFLLQNAEGKVYRTLSSNKWTTERNWIPEYPGKSLSSTDTILIEHFVILNCDIDVNGLLMVDNHGALFGSKRISISPKGQLVNRGNTISGSILNEGVIINSLILEATEDFINSGSITNNEHMFVGSNFYNDGGTVEGTDGHIYSNENIYNSEHGLFGGKLDICFGDYLDNDGSFDSLSLTLCGDKFFYGMSATAELTEDGAVILNVYNPNQYQVSYFRIMRSSDRSLYRLVGNKASNVVSYGNTSTPVMAFKDYLQFNRKVSYRIECLSDDGSSFIFPEITLEKPGKPTRSDERKASLK